MKKFLKVFFVLILFFAVYGCGGGQQQGNAPGGNQKVAQTKGAATPEEAFNNMTSAMANGEFEKVYDCVIKDTQKKFDEQAKQLAKQMGAQKIKPEDVAQIKKIGLDPEKLKNPTGRDVLRIGILMAQMMMEAFQSKDKNAKKIDFIEEIKKSAQKIKITKVTMAADKKSAIINYTDDKGKAKAEKAILEDGVWKLEGKDFAKGGPGGH